ncbi:major facilitator superfamily MFS_1 [Thermoanaerobacter ethanolicus JW 200]|uniref:MFS transporter n=1 Tax=Thermoanaerobacter ethanolicus TaxID=1757 RepID=UPI000202E177|nr:major facilitator superfamily MFS_1 [Thermoanaerobacter ethanolicus JW 200]
MKIEKNIMKFTLYNIFTKALFMDAIFTLYLFAHGLNVTQIMLLGTFSFLTTTFFEVPGGAVADKFGRKYGLFFGAFLQAIGVVFFIIGQSYLFFIAGSVIFSIGATFISGTDNAYLYDFLKENNIADKFQQIDGSRKSKRITDLFKDKGQVYIYVVLFLFLILMSQIKSLYFALPLLFIFHAIRGTASPYIFRRLNECIISEMRASILSFYNLLMDLFVAVAAPLLGYLMDRTGIYYTYLIMSLSFLCLIAVISLLKAKKIKKRDINTFE